MTTDDLRELAEALGERTNGHPEALEDVLPRLVAVLEESDHPDVLTAATYALGMAWDPRAVEVLLRFVPVDHPNPEVRLALAGSLAGGVVDDATPAELRERAVAALVRLTRDPVDDVRDWACFGLGQVGADGQVVRDALADRLDDADRDARAEARLALSFLGDERALVALLELLEAEDEDIGLLDLEAAVELADPALHEALVRVDQEWAGHEDQHVVRLRLALTRCDPAAPARAREVAAELVRQLRDLLPGGEWDVRTVGAYPRTRVVVARPGLPAVELEVFGDLPRGARDPFEHPTRQQARQVVTWCTPPHDSAAV